MARIFNMLPEKFSSPRDKIIGILICFLINSLWETLDSSCLRFLFRFPENAIYNCQGEQRNFFKGGGGVLGKLS